jgi:hypothetical protein
MRLADFAWTSPPPTSIDERLVLYDDGTAWLVVRRPRDRSPSIGSYVTRPSDADRDILAAGGPEPRTIDLLGHDQPLQALFPALDRICEGARGAPESIATFHGRVVGDAGGGILNIATIVVGGGRRPVEFELDSTRCAAHFFAEGREIGWLEFPELQTGFITSDARGLGGLHRAAIVPPGEHGLVSVALSVPSGADSLSVQVAGWLESTLPDDPSSEPFEVHTAVAPLAG